MIDPHEKDAKLLAETFHDDWSGGPTANFARAAAAHARRRRRLRRSVPAAAALAVLLAAGYLATPRTRVEPASPTVASTPVAAPAYEVISDDELLARVRDRTLFAVVRPDGTRAIVVLEPEEKSAPLE